MLGYGLVLRVMRSSKAINYLAYHIICSLDIIVRGNSMELCLEFNL